MTPSRPSRGTPTFSRYSIACFTGTKVQILTQLFVKDGWEVVQNKVPKILADTLQPAKWPANPAKEWCPPGHGDLYPALAGTMKAACTRSLEASCTSSLRPHRVVAYGLIH